MSELGNGNRAIVDRVLNPRAKIKKTVKTCHGCGMCGTANPRRICPEPLEARYRKPWVFKRKKDLEKKRSQQR